MEILVEEEIKEFKPFPKIELKSPSPVKQGLPDVSQPIDTFTPTKEEALGKIAMKLAETEDEKILTELKDEHIAKITSLLSVAEKYNIPIYEKICETFMRLKVSKDRKGRKELLEIAKAVRDEELGKMNKLKNLFGWRR